MSNLRAAAQQALKALEGIHRVGEYPRLQPAITALRDALAESEQDWSILEAAQESLREHMAEIHRLRAALEQQAEPVAVLAPHCSPLAVQGAVQCGATHPQPPEGVGCGGAHQGVLGGELGCTACYTIAAGDWG